MNNYSLTFVESVVRTPTIQSFRFFPREEINFLPGQFLKVVFDEENSKNKNLNKFLSFSCAPGKPYIEVTKRLTGSDFSEKFLNLKKGDEVLINAPMGKCTIEDFSEKYLFLIGGIGITPVISILEFLETCKKRADIQLLYSNLIESDIPFEKELENWSRSINKIEITHTIVDNKPANPNYFFGLINDNFVKEQVKNFLERRVYIFGPPGMVKAMVEICERLGFNKEKIVAEKFIGY